MKCLLHWSVCLAEQVQKDRVCCAANLVAAPAKDEGSVAAKQLAEQSQAKSIGEQGHGLCEQDLVAPHLFAMSRQLICFRCTPMTA